MDAAHGALKGGGMEGGKHDRYGDDRGHDGHGDPAQIERDIDRTLARLDDKVGALKERLSFKSLSEDLANAMSGGAGLGSKKALEGIKANPVPAALVGLGVAWLLIDRAVSRGGREPGIIGRMAGRQSGVYREREWPAPGAEYAPGGPAYSAGYGGGYGGGDFGHETGGGPSALRKVGEKVSAAASGIAHTAQGIGRTVGHAGEKVKDAAQRTGERVSGLAHQAKEGAGDLAHRAKEGAGHLSHKARETAQRAKEGIADTYERNPLIIGAAALALGILGGLAVPTTRAEDRLMGRASRRVKDTTKRVGEKAVEAGKQVAQRSAQEINGAMQDLKEGEGSEGGQGEVGGRFAEKVAETVKAIGDEVRTQTGELKQSLTGGSGGGPGGRGGQELPGGQGV